MDLHTITRKQDLERSEWAHPIPLLHEMTNTTPYPVDMLPHIVQKAVVTYQRYGQQPIPLIACSALANVSLACQSLANVARDKLLISPVSLYFIAVASSGERKSASDNTFSKAIRDWESVQRHRLEPEINAAMLLHQAWKEEKDGLLKQIKRNAADGDLLRTMLVDLANEEPTIPLLPMLFFEDTTQEALASQLGTGWPSASLWSDEGGLVLSGHGMQNNTTKFIALLNRLWDGKPFFAHRKSSQNITIEDRRLTVSIMMQPLILEHMLEKKDGISRQSGFLARSLITYPKTSMGKRYYQEPPGDLCDIANFHDRITECLDGSLTLTKKGCHDLPTLTFSKKAKTQWINFFNQTEAGLQSSMQWQSVSDFASKAAENVARLSALFHLFEGNTGDISVEDVERAIGLICWHLSETKAILGATPDTVSQHDAHKILTWITERSFNEITPQYLQQYGPIRDKTRRDSALRILEETHHLKMIKRQSKTIILLTPYLLESGN